jgi:hypothetical protein
MVVSESSVGEVGDNIPSSSDEEGCIDMMGVENKRCHVSDAFTLHGSPRGNRSTGQLPASLTPNRVINKARVSRHVRVPSAAINFWIYCLQRGRLFSHSNFRGGSFSSRNDNVQGGNLFSF